MTSPALPTLAEHDEHTAAQRNPLGANHVGVAVLALAALTWLVLSLGGNLHGLAHGTLAQPSVGAVARALSGWALMVVAMMLPAALPLFALAGRLLEDEPTRARLAGLAAVSAGFLTPWLVAGLAAIGADAAIHQVAHRLGVESDGHPLVLGIGLAGAGVVQFTPLTRRCLDACRTPEGFALQMWQGRSVAVDAAHLGWAYGLSCVGCCWALMVIGFAVGLTSLPVMVALTVLMTAERLAPAGRRIANLGGVAAVGAAPLVALFA